MSIMLDIIGSAIIVGLLILTVLGININMSDQNFRSLSELNMQQQTIQLARIFEFDLYKAGFRVPSIDAITGEHIAIADTSHIKFYANLNNMPGEKDSVEYNLGGYVASSHNPHVRSLYRWQNTSQVFINFNVTRFKLDYYNSRDSLLVAPVAGKWRDSIKAIKVYLTLENSEPFDTSRFGGVQFIGTYYQKLTYPRSL